MHARENMKQPTRKQLVLLYIQYTQYCWPQLTAASASCHLPAPQAPPALPLRIKPWLNFAKTSATRPTTAVRKKTKKEKRKKSDPTILSPPWAAPKAWLTSDIGLGPKRSMWGLSRSSAHVWNLTTEQLNLSKQQVQEQDNAKQTNISFGESSLQSAQDLATVTTEKHKNQLRIEISWKFSSTDGSANYPTVLITLKTERLLGARWHYISFERIELSHTVRECDESFPEALNALQVQFFWVGARQSAMRDP